MVDEVPRRVDHFAQVVRRDVRRHADGDPLGPVDEEVRKARRQDDGLLVSAVVVRDKVDGVLVDTFEKRHRERREARFRVSHRRGERVGPGGAEVTVAVDERVAQAEVLHHARQRVVDRGVTVGVVPPHDVTDDTRALHVRAIWTQSAVPHRIEDPTMDGLQSVPHVRERARDDDRHGVLKVRALHLFLKFDRLDNRLGRRFCVRPSGRPSRTRRHRLLPFFQTRLRHAGSLPDDVPIKCRGSGHPSRSSG